MRCLKCNNDSGKSKFCRKCRKEKQDACAIVSQNKKKLENILCNPRWTTPDLFAKITLYCGNILKYGRTMMEYKEVDVKRTFSSMLHK